MKSKVVTKSPCSFGQRILAICLCCVMFLASPIQIQSLAESDNPGGIAVSGYSLTVSESSLGMNIYISGLSETELSNAYILRAGEKFPLIKYKQGIGKATLLVAPGDIATVYSLQLYVNGRQTSFVNGDMEITCSVKQYLDAIRNEDSATGHLAQAIDDYGTCAKNYFDRGSADMPKLAEPADLSDYRAKVEGELPDGISYCGSSIILRERLAIRHYFEVTRIIPDSELATYSLQVNGSPIVYQEAAPGLVYVEINDIPTEAIDQTYTMTVGGSRYFELAYSVLSYVASAAEKQEKEKLCELVKSIYWYHEAFEACLTQPQGIEAYKNSKYKDKFGPAVILLPVTATEEEQYAAGLIQKAFEELDGYLPDILTDAVAPGSTGKREIAVGNTNRPHGHSKYHSEGSYSIKAYDGGVAITGVGNRGVIDGSVYFLQLCGGYFWLSWDRGMKSNQDCFKYSPDIDYDYERAFTFTDVDLNYWQGVSGRNRMYSLYFGLNGTFANVQMSKLPGSQQWYLSRKETYNGIHNGLYDYLQPGHAHTLLAEYFEEGDLKSHPDWFVKPNEEIAWNQRQVCTSNAGVYKRIRDCVFEMLDNDKIYDPEAPMQIICLSQSDNGVICYCQQCSDFRKAHYKDTSDYQNDNPAEANAALYLDLCNKISGEIKQKGLEENKDYSNVYVDMLAYVSNKQPPVNMTIDDHVIIRYAPIERCYAHSLKESAGVKLNSNAVDRENGCYECNEMALYLTGWADLVKANPGAQLWIWDYTVNFRDTYAPFPNIYAMIEDIQFYKELGISGIYLQNSDRMNRLNTEYGDLRIYILSELLRNPEADVEKELAFFANEFYGEGGEAVLETLGVLTDQARRHNVGPNACLPELYPTWLGKTYFNNIAYRDHGMTFLAPISQIYNNNYPAGMDPHNGMTAEAVAKVDELYAKALEASADTPSAYRNIQRTMLGWRAVKSMMRVAEFSNSATYLQENRKLYHDIFDADKFGMTAFSLLYGGIPKDRDNVLSKSPDEWILSF